MTAVIKHYALPRGFRWSPHPKRIYQVYDRHHIRGTVVVCDDYCGKGNSFFVHARVGLAEYSVWSAREQKA